jgi:DNA-binding transcriptional LysR family regulator
MLDALSLDQLRIFVAAVESGSFSAAGRQLGRAQSVVSQSLANLEGHLQIRLFDRAGRNPVLTDEGRAILDEARRMGAGADRLKARARGLAGGLEPELAVAIDVMFPIQVVTAAVAAFGEAFPDTPLRLYVEALGAVVQKVTDGTCALCVMGSLPTAPADFSRERLLGVPMVRVAAPGHPLARLAGPIPEADLAGHVQLVLTDRSNLSSGQEFSVLSGRTWRLADLGAKHAFLRAGLGWGGMPLSVVAQDLAQGTLVTLSIEDRAPQFVMPMWAAWPTKAPPGPAGRWLIARLREVTAQCPEREKLSIAVRPAP